VPYNIDKSQILFQNEPTEPEAKLMEDWLETETVSSINKKPSCR